MALDTAHLFPSSYNTAATTDPLLLAILILIPNPEARSLDRYVKDNLKSHELFK
jgi:hypothetical protein